MGSSRVTAAGYLLRKSCSLWNGASCDCSEWVICGISSGIGRFPAGLHLPLRLPRAYEAVTKLVPSAKSGLGCSTFAFPVLPCRAIRLRRYAARAEFVPPLRRSIEFCNSLTPRRVGQPFSCVQTFGITSHLVSSFSAISNSLVTLFQFLPVPVVPSFFPIAGHESFERPMPLGK